MLICPHCHWQGQNLTENGCCPSCGLDRGEVNFLRAPDITPGFSIPTTATNAIPIVNILKSEETPPPSSHQERLAFEVNNLSGAMIAGFSAITSTLLESLERLTKIESELHGLRNRGG